MLVTAERPLIVAGGGIINADVGDPVLGPASATGGPNRHTGGLDVYRRGRRFVHVDIEPTQIGRVFAPDYSIVSDAGAALALLLEVARERKAAGRLRDYSAWVEECVKRKDT